MQYPQGVYNNPAFYGPGDQSDYAPTPGSAQPSPAFLPSPGLVPTPSQIGESETERKQAKSRLNAIIADTSIMLQAPVTAISKLEENFEILIEQAKEIKPVKDTFEKKIEL
ncbi:hypothetical protein MRX96_057033 [Rhipicephalus microplus]